MLRTLKLKRKKKRKKSNYELFKFFNMKKSNPEKFLDTQELSALENETLTGGNASVDDIEVKKEKKKESK